jgi:hypothetical protein
MREGGGGVQHKCDRRPLSALPMMPHSMYSNARRTQPPVYVAHIKHYLHVLTRLLRMQPGCRPTKLKLYAHTCQHQWQTCACMVRNCQGCAYTISTPANLLVVLNVVSVHALDLCSKDILQCRLCSLAHVAAVPLLDLRFECNGLSSICHNCQFNPTPTQP